MCTFNRSAEDKVAQFLRYHGMAFWIAAEGPNGQTVRVEKKSRAATFQLSQRLIVCSFCLHT